MGYISLRIYTTYRADRTVLYFPRSVLFLKRSESSSNRLRRRYDYHNLFSNSFIHFPLSENGIF